MPHVSKRIRSTAASALVSRHTWEVIAAALTLVIMTIPAMPSFHTIAQGLPDPRDRTAQSDRAIEEVWSADVTGSVMRAGESLIAVTPEGLLAVDLSTGQPSWKVPGLTTVVAVSYDGYILAADFGNPDSQKPTVFAWISPVGDVLWQLARDSDESSPLNRLNLNQPKASAAGTVVFPGRVGGSLQAVSPDGTIDWSIDATSSAYFSAASSLDEPMKLPSTLIVDPPYEAEPKQSWQFTSYDVLTGNPHLTFDVIEPYGEAGLDGPRLFLWRDWAVWQTAGVDSDHCLLHGRGLVDGTEWQQVAPCLSYAPMVAQGRIGSAGERPDGVLAQTQLIDMRSGERVEMGTLASGYFWTFGDSASPLAVAGRRGDSVVGFGLDDGSELWSTNITPDLPAVVVSNGELLAIVQSSLESESAIVSTVDAATGQILETFATPTFGPGVVAPISPSQILVAADGHIRLYRAN